MQSVRAKFKVESNKDGQIQLSPVVGGSAENDRFYQATPGGNVSLSTVNEEAAGFFCEGKEYYLDFTAADVEKAQDANGAQQQAAA